MIPSKENEDRSARPVEFDKQAYRRRSIVENLIDWLKECRRVFSRFEKTAKNFGGMIKIAFIERYLRLTCWCALIRHSVPVGASPTRPSLIAPAGSYRSGGGGNEAVGASETNVPSSGAAS